MPTYYSKEVVDSVQELLNTPPSVQPIGTSWQKIMQKLKLNKIVKDKRLVRCKYILPHPKNRSGMMINGFNSRANGSKVVKVGANRLELHGAVAIELSPFPAAAKQQLESNFELAKRSKGLIPPPCGEEFLLSLGTGHMCAFVRAAQAGLKACFKNLADKDGNISLEVLNKDPEFRLMLDEGWLWDILPWQVEATWPSLPEFAQRALNSSNAVSTDATEWEVAITMGEWFNSMEEPSWALAEEAAAAGDPACVSYIGKIRTLVEKFGGGGEFPLIKEQEDFYKTLGANKRLGEGFCRAIIDVKLDEYSPRLHVRHALIALNLTSSKTEDGIVKFVLKSHISALASKDAKPTTLKADDELNAGREFLLELAAKNRISAEQFTELLGIFRVRYGGFLTKLNKDTFEGTVYKSATEIVAKLLAESLAAIKAHNQPGDQVAIPAILRPALNLTLGDSKGNEDCKNGKHNEADKQAALTISEASSWAEAAKAKGFKLGSLCIMKRNDPKRLEGHFKLKSIGSQVELDEIDAFKSDLMTVKVAFPDFMKQWVMYKGDIPMQIDGKWTMPCNLFLHEVEETRAKLFIELRGLAVENESPPFHELVLPCFKPQCLRALCDLPKGEIVIYPTVSSISQITTKANEGATAVVSPLTDDKGNKVVCYVGAPPQPKAESVANWKDGELISPIKWLTEDSNDEAVNMILKEHKTNGFVIPYYESKRALKKFEKLIVKKSSKRKAGEL